MRSNNLAITAILLLAFISGAKAQDTPQQMSERVFFDELNRIYNPLGLASTPISLAYNKVRDVAVTDVAYISESGDYKAINAGDGVNAFSVGVDGLMSLGKLSVDGGMRYNNTFEKNQAWGSELYLSEYNPYVLGNQNEGDRRLEEFDLYAGISYELNAWTLGLRIDYIKGAMSDRFDPRAETNAMRFEVEPGTLWKLNNNFSIGASGIVGLYNSQTSHTIVNNLLSYNYYLMKGCGNYDKRTSGEFPSYPREYNGSRYQGAIQLLSGDNESDFSNMTELLFESKKEVALDGSGNLVYRGGDFHSNTFSFKNHTLWRKTNKVNHSLLFDANMSLNRGMWYDQKRVVDTDHGNVNSYEILQYYQLNTSNIIDAELAYSIDFLNKGLMPNYSLMLRGGYTSNSLRQNDGIQFVESYDHYKLSLEAKKHWMFGGSRLSLMMGGNMRMNLTDPIMDVKDGELNDIYTNPRFAYLSSENVAFHAKVSYSTPISSRKQKLRAGVEINGSIVHQINESQYYTFASKQYSCAGARVFMTF